MIFNIGRVLRGILFHFCFIGMIAWAEYAALYMEFEVGRYIYRWMSMWDLTEARPWENKSRKNRLCKSSISWYSIPQKVLGLMFAGKRRKVPRLPGKLSSGIAHVDKTISTCVVLKNEIIFMYIHKCDITPFETQIAHVRSKRLSTIGGSFGLFMLYEVENIKVWKHWCKRWKTYKTGSIQK